MNELEQELRKKVPVDNIHINREKRVICYYDYQGFTHPQSETQKQVVADYLNQAVSEQMGFPIRITRWGPRSGGHYAHHFQRIQEDKNGNI